MKGFTLLEVIITVTILSLVMIGVFSVFNIADKGWNQDMGVLDLHQEARQVMDRMVKEIRQSKNEDITISNAGEKVDFIIPTGVANSTITYSDTISYYRNVNNQIIREHPVNNAHVLANNIVGLNFSIAGSVLTVQLAAKKTVRGRDLCFPTPCEDPQNYLKEEVNLRNE